LRFEPVLADDRDALGEGPFWDAAAGQLYWADIIGRRAHRLTPATGAHEVWHLPDVLSTIVPARDGRLLVALRDRLAWFDPKTGVLDDFTAPEVDVQENRANEARVDPTGRFWLGTMRNNLDADGEDVGVSESGGALYRIEPDGTWTTVATGIGIANTLLWDTERRRMYFADTLKSTIWAWDWDAASGEVSGRRVFAATEGRGFPDGSALDEEGCVWNARWDGACLIRYRPDGAIDRVVEVPVTRPTSCVFGGPDRRTLYVTSSGKGLAGALEGALLTAEAPVAGQPCTRFGG